MKWKTSFGKHSTNSYPTTNFPSTNVANTALPDELPPEVTRQVQEAFYQEEISPQYPEIFYTEQKTLLWLPEEKPLYENMLKHIPKLLHITQAQIQLIATRTIDNPKASTMAIMDFGRIQTTMVAEPSSGTSGTYTYPSTDTGATLFDGWENHTTGQAGLYIHLRQH